MELTLREIEQKNKQLEKDIKNLLAKHKKETEIIVTGEVNYGYTDETYKHYLRFKYKNPFE